MFKKYLKIILPFSIFALLLVSLLIAGTTSNISTPEPTMYSIADIYALIDDTATTTKTLSPGETYGSSMNSISELYVKLANLIDETKLASPSVTYLGVTGGTTPTPVDDITKEFTPTSNSNTVTGFTLEDIYDLIMNNTRPLTPGHSFAPDSTPASTMHSLNDIYTELSTLIDPANVLLGQTYLGVEGEYDGLISYWSFDGNANDEIGNNDGVVNGATLTTGIGGVADTAYYFNNNYIEVPIISNDFAFGTNDFSISFWLKADTFPDWAAIITHINQFDEWGSGWVIQFRDDEKIGIGIPGVDDIRSTSSLFIPNQWTLITITRENGIVNFYSNNNLNSSMAYLSDWTQTDYLYFGVNSGGAGMSLDNIRIYNRALTDTEIETIYDAEKPDIVTSLRSGLVGYWPLDDTSETTASDESGNNNDGNLNGGVLVNQTGKVGQAMSFDGVDDNINIGDIDILEPHTGDFSISTWFKTTGSAGNIVAKMIGNSPYTGYQLLIKSTAEGIAFDAVIDGWSNFTDVLSAGTETYYTDGEWHHVVVTVDRTTLDATFVVDGEIESTNYYHRNLNSTSDIQTDNNLRIGTASDRGIQNFTGTIDEVAIWNRVLTTQEISDLYNSGSGRSLVQ